MVEYWREPTRCRYKVRLENKGECSGAADFGTIRVESCLASRGPAFLSMFVHIFADSKTGPHRWSEFEYHENSGHHLGVP